MMHVSDIMSPVVSEVDQTSTILQAAQLMAHKRVGSLIVTVNGLPRGIVTEADMARKVVATQLDLNHPVSTIMTSPLMSASPAAEIMEVASMMTQHHIKKIPVIESDNVLGIVTQTDIVKYLFRMADHLSQEYESGQISQADYAKQSEALFTKVKGATSGQEKTWHMMCHNCGHQFLNTENAQGQLQITQCPSCGSDQLDYDQSPHI